MATCDKEAQVEVDIDSSDKFEEVEDDWELAGMLNDSAQHEKSMAILEKNLKKMQITNAKREEERKEEKHQWELVKMKMEVEALVSARRRCDMEERLVYARIIQMDGVEQKLWKNNRSLKKEFDERIEELFN